jgi:hypothetical protein
MEHFAGLDVSVKETGICIVDDTGRIVREADIRRKTPTRHKAGAYDFPERVRLPRSVRLNPGTFSPKGHLKGFDVTRRASSPRPHGGACL